MDPVSLNPLAIAAAVVAKQALGFAWYSRPAFGEAYAHAINLSPEEMKPRMAKAIGGDVAGAVLMALGLAVAVAFAAADGWLEGLLIGLGAWLCFVVPASAAASLFETRSWQAFAIQNGYFAVALAVMGAILAGWR